MDCPPIPPNCIQFQKSGNSLIDSFNTPAWYVALITIHNDSYWRPIIAAIARCAWLDEGMRRIALKDAIDGGCLTAVRYDAESERNAEAWRVWGLKQ